MRKISLKAGIVKRNIKLKYRSKIMIVTLGYTLIPFLLLSFCFMAYTSSVHNDKIVSEYRNRLSDVVKNIDNLYYNNYQKILYIKNNIYISCILNLDEEYENTEIFYNYQMFSDLLNILRADGQNDGIKIFSYNPMTYKTDYIKDVGNLNTNIREEVENSEGAITVWNLEENAGKQFISIYDKIISDNQICGIIKVDVSVDRLRAFMNSDYPEDTFAHYITSENQKVAVLYPQNPIDNEELKASRFTPITMGFKNNNHRIVLYINSNIVMKEIKNYLVIFSFCILIIIGLIIFLVRNTSKKVTESIYDLIKLVNTDIEGFAALAENEVSIPNDEIEVLRKEFLRLLKKIKLSYENVRQHEINEKRLELELLQANICPHFLYNSLSAIRWMYPDDKLSEMIGAMVKFYRIGLNKGNNILRVSDELDMIVSYIIVQKMAFRSEMEYIINVDEDIMNKKILKNLLQPIVENAILHGINGNGGVGKLEIIGKKINGDIQFRIIDNGVGMEEEKAQRILIDDMVSKTDGYGLKNVLKRIRSYYGAGYDIRILSKPGKGTCVTANVPCVD